MSLSESTFRWLALAGLALVALLLCLDLVATDRLERQVIATRLAVEGAADGGPVSTTADTEAVPGQPTGRTAVGWEGRPVPVLHVSGAVPDAPRSLADKPRPQGGVYRLRAKGAPATINPYLTRKITARGVADQLHCRLVLVDPEHPPAVLGGLAEAWEVSEDGLVATFHLRRGVQFADGREVTAADVVFSWGVARDPAVGSALASLVEGVVAVEAPDPHTAVVRFSAPWWKSAYAVGSGLYVLNRAWWAEELARVAAAEGLEPWSATPGAPGFATAFARVRRPGPGCGPYVVAGEYDPGTRTLVAHQNPVYYGTQVRPEWFNLGRLEWVFIADDVAALEAFRQGRIDQLAVSFADWDDELSADPTLTARGELAAYDHTGIGYWAILWNTRRPPLDDAQVRRALTHLVDRQWIVTEVERGRGQVATTPTKPAYPEYAHDLVPWPFDPEAAAALLDEAGWTDSDGDGVRDRDGARFEIELTLPGPQRFNVQVAEALRGAAARVGVRLTSRTLESGASLYTTYNERSFDGLLLFAGFADPWVDLEEDFHSSADVPGGSNATGWRNDRVDALLEALHAERDPERRVALWREFAAIFHAEQPMTLIHHSLAASLRATRFQDAGVLPTGMRLHRWWVRPEDRVE